MKQTTPWENILLPLLGDCQGYFWHIPFVQLFTSGQRMQKYQAQVVCRGVSRYIQVAVSII